MILRGAPFCSEENFQEAFQVIREARIEDCLYGTVAPSYAPGGYYGACWWSLDYALACEGVKWADFDAAKDLIRNLKATQCENGRIKLYGADDFSHVPNVREPIGSLPKYFETCYAISRMSGDSALCRDTLDMFEGSLDWWISHRLSPETGLFSAVFEETFIANNQSSSRVYAPVDTNVQLAIGMENTAKLMRLLGVPGHEKYDAMARDVKNAVAKWLWDEEKGAYYPRVLTQGRLYPALMGSTFMGFACPDAPSGQSTRHNRLEALLRNTPRFGWDETPITSVARDDPLFTLVAGDYNGNPAWSGSIWTLINEQAVRALHACGRRETACELAVKTLSAFQGNYAEFLNPFTRSGEGVHRYAWSASQCIRLTIEEIFGLSYDGFSGRLCADPAACPALRGQKMELLDIPLPDGRRADAVLLDGNVEIHRA